jgi:hypothetical protein
VRAVERRRGIAHRGAPRSASARRALAHAIAVPTPKQTIPCSASRSSENVATSPAGSSARSDRREREQRPERRRSR